MMGNGVDLSITVSIPEDGSQVSEESDCCPVTQWQVLYRLLLNDSTYLIKFELLFYNLIKKFFSDEFGVVVYDVIRDITYKGFSVI